MLVLLVEGTPSDSDKLRFPQTHPDRDHIDSSAISSTVVPSSAGSSTFHSHLTPSLSNQPSTSVAMASKLAVASARMVGPAPDRQMPHRPGWVVGVTDERILVRPGTSAAR